MVRLSVLSLFPALMLLAYLTVVSGADVTGIELDVFGNPIIGAHIEHTGRPVVLAAADLAVDPPPDEVRSEADGRFRVATDVTAMRPVIPQTENTGGDGASSALRPNTTTRVERLPSSWTA